MQVHVFACQHAGKSGTPQQDALAIGPEVFQRRHWHTAVIVAGARLAVADGVSGSPHAALAARSLLEALCGEGDGARGRRTLGNAVHHWHAQNANPSTRGGATTLACLDLFQGHANWLNCGDSRIYRARWAKDEIHWQLLSRDHTFAQELADADRLEPNATGSVASLTAGVLTSCMTLGETDPAPQVHQGHARALADDLYLVSTDGVHGVLTPEQMRLGLGEAVALDAVGKTWWQQIMHAGAPDNFSFILCRVDAV